MNRKRLKLLIAVCAAVVVSLVSSISCFASPENNQIPYSTFSYWEGDTSTQTDSKPLYGVDSVLTAGNLGISTFSELSDVCSDSSNNLFILDGKGSRIVILDSSYHVLREITNISFPEKAETFSGARGIFVDKDGLLYIADTENARVIKATTTGNGIEIITLPDSEMIPSDFNYRPIKIAVDSSGYIYVLSDGSYYGAILYSPEKTLLGFYGANTVKTTVTQFIQKLWNNLTQTDAKRAASTRKLPYQLTDLYVDNNDFVYTATGKTENDQIAQIKRLSPGGKNILSSDDVVFGNKEYAIVDEDYYIQNIAGVVTDSKGFIYCYDVSYGNIYLYDNECYLLGAFGGGLGKGTQKGTFEFICAIDILDDGDRIFIADKNKQNITVFKITDYGKKLKQARYLTLMGDYDNSVPLWNQLLKEDANCQLAYNGLATAEIANKNYKNALKDAKAGLNKKIYSQAFTYVRKQNVEKNISFYMIGIIAIAALVISSAVIIKKKKIRLIKNKSVREALLATLHPAEVYNDVKTRGTGSIVIAGIFVILFYISSILKSTTSSFLFKSTSTDSFNSLFVLMQTVGFIALWTIVNWAVAVLFGGIGKVKEIFIVISYAMLPMIAANFIYLILSYALNLSEGSFLTVLVTASMIYSVIMVIIGSIIVHDISFGKFIGITLLTFIGILIVILLIALIVILFQQTYSFVGTLIRELFFR